MGQLQEFCRISWLRGDLQSPSCFQFFRVISKVQRQVQKAKAELADSLRMELELVEVVEYGIFVGVDGAVVGESACEGVLGVVRADDDDLRQVDHPLA